MDSNPSTWLRFVNHTISNKSLYDMQAGFHRLSKKEVLMREHGKTDPTNPIDGKAVMPDNDIAALGMSKGSDCVRVCGDFIEVYITTASWIEGKGKMGGGSREKDEDKAKELRRNSVARSAKRAEKTVRRLVNTNHLTTMWTLTLAPNTTDNTKKFDCISADDQRDIQQVKQVWRNFYRKLYEYKPGIKWLVVFELHDSNKTSDVKRGTWHLHFATDTRLQWEAVNHLWNHGIVRFDDFSKPKKGVREGKVRNPGAYMSKYIGKNFDESNFHVKRYSRSRNMEIPEKITLHELLLRLPGLETLEEVFHTERIFEYDNVKYYNQNTTYARRALN